MTPSGLTSSVIHRARQAGFRTSAGVPWSDISRGMHREHRGQPCCDSDERQRRAFWRQWQKLMSPG
jgi:benzoate/toluate 1,2-dioxygenase alpha subunit/p-cumate 2,3-dioxygenase alpha subunit